MLIKKTDYDSPEREDDLMPTQRNKKARTMGPFERQFAISRMLEELKNIPQPGIRPIKQVELYLKWRKVIPDNERRDITCPRPSDDVMQQVMNNRRTSNKRKRGEGVQSITNNEMADI